MGRKCFLSLLIIAVLIIPSLISAGWMRTYGGEEADGGSRVWQTSDGGYIVVGKTASFGAGLADIWLLKTDSEGDTLWTKTFGDEGEDYGYCVQQTSDGGYIVSANLGLIKTDAEGEIQWTSPYGAYCVDQTDDGGYVLVSTKDSHVWLIKTDEVGDTVWTREFGDDFYGWGTCVRQTSDGGYIIAAQKTEIGLMTRYWKDYGWFFKTNADGDMLWDVEYDGEKGTCGYSACETPDGGYVFAGVQIWVVPYLLLVKTNSFGHIEWEYSLESNEREGISGYCVAPTSDSGCIVADGEWTLYKLNVQGDIIWIRDYGCAGVCVRVSTDGGYIVTGSKDGDLYLLKTDAYGDTSGVMEKPPETPVIHPSNWRVLAPVGQRIVLKYVDMPQGLHVEVFDASGHKVDAVHSYAASGRITWGEEHPSGVYFIKSDTDAGSTRKVILIK